MRKKVLVWLAGAAAGAMIGATTAEIREISPDDSQITRWNNFVAQLYALHEKRLAQRATETSERIGGYYRQPRFYREVTYRDRETDRPLSIVQWERAKPENLHSIRVFIYDNEGRLARDYAADFLPDARNAPVQTLVRLYHHADGVDAYRVFDASGETLYENCTGMIQGKKVDIDLDIIDLLEAQRIHDPLLDSDAYRTCFAPLPKTAGKYLTPH